MREMYSSSDMYEDILQRYSFGMLCGFSEQSEYSIGAGWLDAGELAQNCAPSCYILGMTLLCVVLKLACNLVTCETSRSNTPSLISNSSPAAQGVINEQLTRMPIKSNWITQI